MRSETARRSSADIDFRPRRPAGAATLREVSVSRVAIARSTFCSSLCSASTALYRFTVNPVPA